MTEWNASDYHQRSALQKWVADECLAGLELAGTERTLDVGCGDGKITAEIAERLHHGSIVGIDPSTHMIEFARTHFSDPTHAHMEFRVGDVTAMTFRDEFDLVVSFNALHWVPEQGAALRCIRNALASSGRTLLQFVPRGSRTSLEDVLEETRSSRVWSSFFTDYRTPYVHFTPAEYRTLAAQHGLRTDTIDVLDKAWDFKTREAFVDFATVTFVEWTRKLPTDRHLDFINSVLDNYRRIGDGSRADANVFHFYQMRVVLRRA